MKDEINCCKDDKGDIPPGLDSIHPFNYGFFTGNVIQAIPFENE